MDNYIPDWIDLRIEEMEQKADNMMETYPENDYPAGEDAYDASLSHRFKKLHHVLPMLYRD